MNEDKLSITQSMPIRKDARESVKKIVEELTKARELQQKAEEKAHQLAAEREKMSILNRFLHNASHDLRTPLAAIKTSLYVLQHFVRDEGYKYYEYVEQNANRLEKIITDMLEMCELDERVIEESLVTVSINAVIKEAVEQIWNDIIRQGHHIRLELASSLPEIEMNVMMMQNALVRILENAVQYTEPGGKITIRSWKDEGRVGLSIQDTGIGISAEDLPHIFDMFFRTDPARSAETGGAGLGLAMARRIIEQHRGQLTVESVPGDGSKFTIEIPLSNVV